MKNFFVFLIFCLFMIFGNLILNSCSKSESPTQPTQTPVFYTFTPSMTATNTQTPTCTNTLTGNVVMLDNFNDGNLYNNYGIEWSPYWSWDGEWASTPVITTDSYSGYALKVTGHVTANTGMPPGPYRGYFGTTTYIDNGNGIDIRPINYINIALKIIKNIPVSNSGDFDKLLISIITPNYSSYANYEITTVPENSWQIYKIQISDFVFYSGDKDDLLSHMGFIGIYIHYESLTLNEEAEAELYVDEVYFSEN